MPINEQHENANEDMIGITRNYGDVWSQPAQNLDSITRRCDTKEAAFKSALAEGYFSQYTSYRQRDLVERLVDWEIDLLAKWLDSDLKKLPDALDELSIIPEVLLVERHGRVTSPDLLRNLWYVLFLCQQHHLSAISPMKNILEIGSGYGSFARIMKAYHPTACVWLVDLPESLVSAETYLRAAYPESNILVINSPEIDIPDDKNYDFILFSVHESKKLFGKQFDLGVNIWSFGEMPNAWIKHWFDLIQTHCLFDYMYILNAFSSPVTTQTLERFNQGNWLFNLASDWEVLSFEINPDIHQCPQIRNFYTGLGILCQRLEPGSERANLVKQSAIDAMALVLQEDWAAIVLKDQSIANLERPESDIVVSNFNLQEIHVAISVKKLLTITEYIGHPRFESGTDSTLFRLWNNFRLNNCSMTGMMLMTYLAMINKSDLNHRISKEEAFLLSKLPNCLLHDEYCYFNISASSPLKIDYLGMKYDVQTACDLARKYYLENNVDAARQIAASVAIKFPQHADCWHQLAQIFEAQNQILLAAIMCTHACQLAPQHMNYSIDKLRLLAALHSQNRIRKFLFALAIRSTNASRNILLQLIKILPDKRKHKAKFAIISAEYFAGKNTFDNFNVLTNIVRDINLENIYEAMKIGSHAYSSDVH